MNHPLCLLAVPFAAALPAQALAGVDIDGASPELLRTLAAAGASLREPCPPAGRPLAMRVLSLLRTGDVAGSAAALAHATDLLPTRPRSDSRRDDVAWLAVAHLWHARASGAPALTPARWNALVAVAEPAAAAPFPSFVDEAMQVHGLFCLGALARLMPGAPDGGAFTQRAIDRQLELERQTWQPGRGCFRSLATAGDLVLPQWGDVQTLRPASAGLLLATGDRMPRHLATVLDDAQRPDRNAEDTVESAALCLVAATQLFDDAARARSWNDLFARTAGRVASEHAGLVIDAVLFATTGARLATGAGLDEAWQRFAPWLPPGHDRLVVRDLLVGGAHYELGLASRSGPAQPDEADTSAHTAGSGERLHVRLTLLAKGGAVPRTVVVAGREAQTVHWLQPGESFCCSLPRSQPDAQNDAHGIRTDPLRPRGGQ